MATASIFGTDPKGAIKNSSAYQQQRYEDQIDPVINSMAMNYGRGSEANYGDYTDIMNGYRSIAMPGNGAAAEGGGGGGGGVSTWGPSKIQYNDPFNSYAGYTDFSKTGGYSPEDIANMRARGVSPVRAAYANAEREVSRQRSLQGGYSPNAFAVQAKMAREQGQSAADATQTVEAGLAKARNEGRLSGLNGMLDTEKQRLAADLDVQKFNANAQMSSDSSNAGASNAASAASRADQLNALRGMTSLYGTTPGMAQLYGDQVLSAIGQSATTGQKSVSNEIDAQKAPGQFEQTTGRVNSAIDTASKIGNVAGTVWNAYNQYKKPKTTATGVSPTWDSSGSKGDG